VLVLQRLPIANLLDLRLNSFNRPPGLWSAGDSISPPAPGAHRKSSAVISAIFTAEVLVLQRLQIANLLDLRLNSFNRPPGLWSAGHPIIPPAPGAHRKSSAVISAILTAEVLVLQRLRSANLLYLRLNSFNRPPGLWSAGLPIIPPAPGAHRKSSAVISAILKAEVLVLQRLRSANLLDLRLYSFNRPPGLWSAGDLISPPAPGAHRKSTAVISAILTAEVLVLQRLRSANLLDLRLYSFNRPPGLWSAGDLISPPAPGAHRKSTAVISAILKAEVLVLQRLRSANLLDLRLYSFNRPPGLWSAGDLISPPAPGAHRKSSYGFSKISTAKKLIIQQLQGAKLLNLCLYSFEMLPEALECRRP
jgi:hypothetical protein